MSVSIRPENQNPLMGYMIANASLGSDRELFGHSMANVDYSLLPDDPNSLKELLGKTVCMAKKLAPPYSGATDPSKPSIDEILSQLSKPNTPKERLKAIFSNMIPHHIFPDGLSIQVVQRIIDWPNPDK
jgi:hypothetical protein